MNVHQLIDEACHQLGWTTLPVPGSVDTGHSIHVGPNLEQAFIDACDSHARMLCDLTRQLAETRTLLAECEQELIRDDWSKPDTKAWRAHLTKVAP